MINRIFEKIENHKIELYVLERSEAQIYSESYFASHFPDRHEKSKKFRFEADRQRCLCVGILLYEILGLEDKDIHFTEHGKPLISSNKTKKINISHSGDYVVLAVSDLEIGVDIERPDREYLDIGKRVFTDAELLWIDSANKEPAVLFDILEKKEPGWMDDAVAEKEKAELKGTEENSKLIDISKKEEPKRICNISEGELEKIDNFEKMDPSERFMLLWTMKESVSKAIGLGLGLDYRSFNALSLLENGRFTAFDRQIVGKPFFFGGYIIFVSLIIE